MSTITTINGTDVISTSRTTINTNFSNLNTDKIETSTLDTDTTLAANSDSKIATQKAVKTYIDTSGGQNASETVRGIVEEATDAEVTAGTATGATGAKLFVTPAKLATRLSGITNPIVQAYVSTATTLGDTTSRFDITNTSGSTYRYTWDGTGTDPVINTSTVPTGAWVSIISQNFNTGNNGSFAVTGSGSNYFEVSNASGVAETDKVLATGGALKVQLVQTWTKPTGLRYIVAEVVGGGGGGGGTTTDDTACGGGGGGGYAREVISASSLSATENVMVGISGLGCVATAGNTGGTSSFGTSAFLQATGGAGGAIGGTSSIGGAGGVGSNGTLNTEGQDGGVGIGNSATLAIGGNGGSSHYGGGARGVVVVGSNDTSGVAGNNYGGGGSGAATTLGGDCTGGAGAPGVVVITEYYS